MLILFLKFNANPLETQLYSCCFRRIIQSAPNEFQLIFKAAIQPITCHINSGHSNVKIYINLKYSQEDTMFYLSETFLWEKQKNMGFFQQASSDSFILKCL